MSDAPDCLRLEAVEGVCTGTVYEYGTATTLTIGRTDASTLHIQDATVSEKHGELVWRDGGWHLTDHDSSNGTAVNGAALNAWATAVLKDGDEVRLGDTRLRAEVVPALGEGLTVEQYLESECGRIIARAKARAERHANELAKEWGQKKKQLLAL